MRQVLYQLWVIFLKIVSDIKIVRYPLWIVYDPVGFKINGWQKIQALRKLQPGDVILRGYDCYIDSKFVPGEWSHAGIYDGNQGVVHAYKNGVERICVLDFLNCDRFLILRLDSGGPKTPRHIKAALNYAYHSIGTPYDFTISKGNHRLYCFELVAHAYHRFNMKKYHPSGLGGLLKGKEKVYLAETFTENQYFKKIMEAKPM